MLVQVFRLIALLVPAFFFGCSRPYPSIGETHTVASAHAQLRTLYWPCFAEKDELQVWLVNAVDRDTQETIENNNAIWLAKGDTVKILQEVPEDALQIHVISSDNGASGKTCWTPAYEGYLFSK